MNNEPVAWMCPTGLEYKQRATDFMYNDALYDKKLNWIPLYTHPAKTQSNLVNVVKNHIKDLQNCVKLFRSAEMDNTADEMEIAIKELEDAMNSHPAKTLTDEEILREWSLTSYDPKTFIWSDDVDADLILQFSRAILRKAQEK